VNVRRRACPGMVWTGVTTTPMWYAASLTTICSGALIGSKGSGCCSRWRSGTGCLWDDGSDAGVGRIKVDFARYLGTLPAIS